MQLIEPELGLGVQELREQGEGTILEMALRVEDIEMACNQMKRPGHFAGKYFGTTPEHKLRNSCVWK